MTNLGELVPNGSFEIDASGWTALAAGDPLSSSVASSQGIGTAIDGTKIALVYSGGGSQHATSYYADIPVEAGVYEFDAWYSQTGAVTSAQGYTLSVVAGEGTVDDAPATGPVGSVWTEVTGQVTMESSGTIRVMFTHSLSGAGSGWFDAISLKLKFPSLGEELYSDLMPLVDVWGDPTEDLRVFCGALGVMLQPVDDIAKDGSNGEPGWSQVLDLVRAKDEWLPWLGQWVGYAVPAKAASETQAAWSARERGRIVSRSTNRRATVALLREVIQEQLTGTKTVIIQERVGGDANAINVYVYNTEIATTSALVQAAALAAKAAGLVMTFTVLTGANYSLLAASNTTYAVMTGKHANYNSVLTNPGL